VLKVAYQGIKWASPVYRNYSRVRRCAATVRLQSQARKPARSIRLFGHEHETKSINLTFSAQEGFFNLKPLYQKEAFIL